MSQQKYLKFIEKCSFFYKSKSKDRIDLFYKSFNQYDNCLIIEDDTFFSKDYHSSIKMWKEIT